VKCCLRCETASPGLIRRRLCGPCYQSVRRNGRLTRYPRTNRPSVDVMADYRILRGRGCTQREAAAQMRMTLTALQRAIYRARAAGTAVHP
jgi:hypothetical protein